MATRMSAEAGAGTLPKVKVAQMDHIVLRVRDVDASLHFYVEVLGLAPERIEQFKAGEVGFPSVRLNGDTIIDLFPSPDMEPIGEGPRNQDHFCMVIEPTDMGQLRDECLAMGIKVRDGWGKRWGAHGDGTSVYIFDPDDNVVELRHYS